MIARELKPLVPIAVLPVRAESVTARGAVPVILRATRVEAPGARMRVGGLRVVDRAIRQLGRLRDARVIVAEDGSIALPRRLPANMERREITGHAEAAVAALEAELGPETTIVGANFVWLQAGRPDRGITVVDRASCRAAKAGVLEDVQNSTVGLINRLINRRIAARLTGLLLLFPISSAAVTLVAGFLALYGALMVATSAGAATLTGFAIIEGSLILDCCADQMSRLRLRQTAFAGWLATVIGDFVNVVLVLAVGISLWHHGGKMMDMKIAAAAAGMTLLYMVVSYRELIRQGEADVMRVRWWFAYGQTLVGARGAGSHSLKGVLLLGRRDMIVLIAIVMGQLDLPIVTLLYLFVVAIVRTVGALGQLVTPEWRIRPPI